MRPREGTPHRARSRSCPRRTLPALALLLPLVLMLAQQGALQHELGHLARTARAQQAEVSASRALQDRGPCLECRAFAQVAHPATGSAAVLPSPPVSPIDSPEPAYSIMAADAPAPRSRGPPQA